MRSSPRRPHWASTSSIPRSVTVIICPSASSGIIWRATIDPVGWWRRKFVYMGMKKAVHPDVFLKLVRQYDLTSNSYFLNVIGAGLPWFEVFCGLLLLAGVAVRGAALMLLLMLMAFTPLVFERALTLAAANKLALCLVKF